MGRKQIIVVNIDDNDGRNDEVVDTTEPVEETIEIPQEAIDKIEAVETTQVDDKQNSLDQQPETIETNRRTNRKSRSGGSRTS
jgi:hypothetical protein